MLVTLLVAFGLGTFIGSFLNVCVHRLPRNESIVLPPSRCYACGSRLTWYDNLPVIGWLLLWGHCRWCGTSFSPRYLIAELIVGILTALTVWWILIHDSPWNQALGWQGSVLSIAAALAFIWFIYVASIIDIDHKIIPDELTKSFQLTAPFFACFAATNVRIEDPLPAHWLMTFDVFNEASAHPMNLLRNMMIVEVIVFVFLFLSLPIAKKVYTSLKKEAPWRPEDIRGFNVGVYWFAFCNFVQMTVLSSILLFTPGSWWPMASILLAQAILGSLAGWMSLYLVGFIGTICMKKNAMGYGDVKFLAPLGSFIGPLGVVYSFFAASIVGSFFGIPYIARKIEISLRFLARDSFIAKFFSILFTPSLKWLKWCIRIVPGLRWSWSFLEKRAAVPFGPYLALGVLSIVHFGPEIHSFFLSRFYLLTP